MHLVAVALTLLAPDGAEPRLRQTGSASGYASERPRAELCGRAEDSAWTLVWRSCEAPHSIEGIVTGRCTTTDYRPAADDGRGAFIEVRVDVEYDCVRR